MGFHLAIASFLIFICFDKKISHFLLKGVRPYQALPKEHQRECEERLTSSIHSILITFTSIYVTMFDDNTKKDLIWGYSHLALLTVAIAAGYFTFDLYKILTDFFRETESENFAFVLHHFAAISSYCFAMKTGQLLYLSNFRLLAEMSTLFVNTRWILHLTGKKDTKLYIYNGLLMTGTFFFSRILVIPYFYYMAFKIVALEEYISVGPVAYYSLISMCLILDCLNVYWFYKMLKGAAKILFGKKSTETSTAERKTTTARMKYLNGCSDPNKQNGFDKRYSPQNGHHLIANGKQHFIKNE